MENRVRFKIGEIEFEAEGSADVIERERKEFLNTLLPAAIEAIVRTRGTVQRKEIIDVKENPGLLLEETKVHELPIAESETITIDLSRKSLASFVKDFGVVTEQDFVLISAYYDEQKNSTSSFSSETVKQYYKDARRPLATNVSDVLLKLSQKGYIMDDPNSTGKSPKSYILTGDGIAFVEKFSRKEEKPGKKNPSSRQKRVRTPQTSLYVGINLDDLHINNYPEVKKLDTFKKQMLLVMFIITIEGKGEFFRVADLQYLMTDIWGIPATVDQIKGVFKIYKTWFKQEQDPKNKKIVSRRLLEGGKDFAREIINTALKEQGKSDK